MPNNETQNKIEKLRKQVKRFEEKGYSDTAAHQMLSNLLAEQPADGVPVRSADKAKQEKTTNAKQDL